MYPFNCPKQLSCCLTIPFFFKQDPILISLRQYLLWSEFFQIFFCSLHCLLCALSPLLSFGVGVGKVPFLFGFISVMLEIFLKHQEIFASFIHIQEEGTQRYTAWAVGHINFQASKLTRKNVKPIFFFTAEVSKCLRVSFSAKNPLISHLRRINLTTYV